MSVLIHLERTVFTAGFIVDLYMNGAIAVALHRLEATNRTFTVQTRA